MRNSLLLEFRLRSGEGSGAEDSTGLSIVPNLWVRRFHKGGLVLKVYDRAIIQQSSLAELRPVGSCQEGHPRCRYWRAMLIRGEWGCKSLLSGRCSFEFVWVCSLAGRALCSSGQRPPVRIWADPPNFRGVRPSRDRLWQL